MSDVLWGQYAQAYKAIFDAVQKIASKTATITKIAFTWNADGSLATYKAYEGADLLFTLSFTWNADGTLKEISRS